MSHFCRYGSTDCRSDSSPGSRYLKHSSVHQASQARCWPPSRQSSRPDGAERATTTKPANQRAAHRMQFGARISAFAPVVVVGKCCRHARGIATFLRSIERVYGIVALLIRIRADPAIQRNISGPIPRSPPGYRWRCDYERVMFG
jgi:hypothetical protein